MEHRGYILSGGSDGAGSPMTESFYEAFINCRHRVLGRNLKPFSLRHCLYLEAIGSPYMDAINGKSAEITRRDLEIAVTVCSAEGDISEALRRIGHIGNLAMKLHPFKRASTRFLSYLSDYIALPELWENGGEPVNAPWILSRVVLLMSKTSLGRNEIWDMPIGEVFWYCAAFGEQEGAAQIQSDAEQLAIEEALKAKNYGKSVG